MSSNSPILARELSFGILESVARPEIESVRSNTVCRALNLQRRSSCDNTKDWVSCFRSAIVGVLCFSGMVAGAFSTSPVLVLPSLTGYQFGSESD